MGETGTIATRVIPRFCSSFFFNDTATTEIYTLSLHDALPIYHEFGWTAEQAVDKARKQIADLIDRKSTRVNSSHLGISYAVFCLEKAQGRAGAGHTRRNHRPLALHYDHPRRC